MRLARATLVLGMFFTLTSCNQVSAPRLVKGAKASSTFGCQLSTTDCNRIRDAIELLEDSSEWQCNDAASYADLNMTFIYHALAQDDNMASEFNQTTPPTFTGVVYVGNPGDLSQISLWDIAGLIAHEWVHQWTGDLDDYHADMIQDQCLSVM